MARDVLMAVACDRDPQVEKCGHKRDLKLSAPVDRYLTGRLGH
jgi:hypothetical protein